METQNARNISFRSGIMESQGLWLPHYISSLDVCVVLWAHSPPFLQCFIQIKLYFPALNILVTNRRGHLMQSYPNGHCIGGVVGSEDGGPESRHNLQPPTWVKCNLNRAHFAGLTLNGGVCSAARQPGLARPWLGRGVKIHLNSIQIHLVQLLATFSNVAFYLKFHYILNGLRTF